MEQQDFEKLIRDLVALPAETECVEFKVNNFSPIEIGKRISALSNAANLYDEKMAYLVFVSKTEHILSLVLNIHQVLLKKVGKYFTFG